MILLDATALIALLTGERAASAVEAILRHEDAAITSANLAETIDVLVRVFGFDGDAVDALMVPLLAVNLGVVSIGEEEARRGASVRATHYHRTRMPLSLADCLLISTASLLKATIATTDALLGQVAVREGVEVRKLPAGTRRNG